MEDYQEKALQERMTLEGKIELLKDLIYSTLDFEIKFAHDEQVRLKRQYIIMCEYLRFLMNE